MQSRLQHGGLAAHDLFSCWPKHVGSGAQMPPLHFLPLPQSVRSVLSAQKGAAGQTVGSGQVHVGQVHVGQTCLSFLLPFLRFASVAPPRVRTPPRADPASKRSVVRREGGRQASGTRYRSGQCPRATPCATGEGTATESSSASDHSMRWGRGFPVPHGGPGRLGGSSRRRRDRQLRPGTITRCGGT
jgi:hypothetical protein